MRKRVIPLLLVLVALVMALGGCTKAPDAAKVEETEATSQSDKPCLVGDIPCAFPLASEKTTLNILATGYGSIDHADVYVWQKHAEKTGVDVNWTTVKRNERSEAVYSALINGQNIDLIMRCKISATRLTQYGENGLIIDFAKDDLLKTYAPNCWAYLQSHPETLASVMNPDGAIYSLPQVNSGAELRVGVKLFVNKKWLENSGAKLPTTTDELYETLKAFREKDGNGNGIIGDELPFCSSTWSGVKESLLGAFGLENRGMHNQTVDCDEATGKPRLIAAAESYKDFLAYANKLYADKLLDNYTFTMTDDQWRSNVANDLVGMFASTNLAWLPADKMDNWVCIEEALEGPNGDKIWSPIRANFHSEGAAVIPATCKNPELVLRWLDYFWTDEGTLFYHMGVEGETFVAKDDGTYDYAPKIYEEMKTRNESFDDVVAHYSPYPGGSNPTVEIAPYFMGGEMAEVPAKGARALFEYGPKEYWPSFTFSAAQNESLSKIKTDIDKYTTSMCIEFVTGVTPLTEWNEYLAQLDKLNLQEMLDIYRTAVDRYHALDTALDHNSETAGEPV